MACQTVLASFISYHMSTHFHATVMCLSENFHNNTILYSYTVIILVTQSIKSPEFSERGYGNILLSDDERDFSINHLA